MRTALLFCFFALPALAQPCPTRATWPTDEWPVELVTREQRGPQLDALEAFAFTLQGTDAERKGLRTDALLIIKHGVLVYEQYGRGFDATKRHISWSVAKSFSSTLIGIAVKHGLLSLDDSICTHLPEFAGRAVCGITVRDVITFGSGLAWQETYEHGHTQDSSVLAMLFGAGHRDQLEFILGHRQIASPGTRWSYSTADAQLASAIARRALERKFGRDAFWSLLFERIGMKKVVFEEDSLGNPLGGSCIYATPRDFAKFGFLFLNDGCWEGTRLVPDGWVTEATTPSPVYLATLPTEPRPSGYSWWLNRPLVAQQRPVPFPHVPEDLYLASGHWGQRIIVIPSEDVVIVRTGDDRETDAAINNDELVRLALDVL